MAERSARDEVEKRATIQKRIAAKDKEAKEEEPVKQPALPSPLAVAVQRVKPVSNLSVTCLIISPNGSG